MKPDVVGLANNDTRDFGESAMFETMELLKENGYTYIGAGKNIEEAYAPAVLSKDGETVAIIAVCENEFGAAKAESAGTAGYALGRVAKAIRRALKNGQKPIIYFHGGNETNPIPSPGKNELYRHFIDLGAKAVIAMHTHCPQGYEYYEGCPIVYSMGNFFFVYPKERQSWFYGYMTMLTIEDDAATIEPVPYVFDEAGIRILEGAEKEQFMQYLDCISAPISSPEKLRLLFDAWCVDTYYLKMLATDFENVYTLSPGEMAPFKNLLGCEAHNEVLTNVLAMIYEGDRVEKARNLKPVFQKLQNMEIVAL